MFHVLNFRAQGKRQAGHEMRAGGGTQVGTETGATPARQHNKPRGT